MDVGVKSPFAILYCQAAQKQCLNSDCANRSNEPLNTKIVFSRGFHDFQSLISTAQKSFKQSYFVQLDIKLCKKDF